MKKRVLKIFLIILTVLVVLGFVLGIRYTLLNNEDLFVAQKEATNNFTIQSNENDNVLITVERMLGIQKIERPDSVEIYCNNKEKVAFDFKVEVDNTYTFKITDSEGNETEEILYVPNAHLELTKNKVNVDFDEFRKNLRSKLWTKNIATNYIKIGIGEESYLSTETTEMGTVFNNWSSFGDGVWTYNSSGKYIYNSKNTDYFTGYYSPITDYNDIELEFEAQTTDSDDDMIGAMIRFNRSGNTYNSYLFLLDNHDTSGKGVSNGAWNGTNKVINKNFATLGHSTMSNITKLSVNASLRWTRNKWQKYKLIAKGTTIQAYIDDKLVSTATDTSISKGSYGFLCMSQAKTSFRTIKVTTTIENTFEDVINAITWDANENNIVIRFNNESETILSEQSVINKFNNDNIHYICVANESNKTTVETFVENIENKGMYVGETLEIDEKLNNIANYINNLVK